VRANHPTPARIDAATWIALAAISAVGCVDPEDACPSGGAFTRAANGQYCSYQSGASACPAEFPHEYRDPRGATICASRAVPTEELPRRACNAAGATRCTAFEQITRMDAGAAEPDADTERDAEAEIDGEAELDAETTLDAEAEIDADAALDAGTALDAGNEADARSETDADTTADAASGESDAAPDGSVTPGDGAVIQQDAATPDAAVVFYEADFTTGQQDWEATGVWTHGPVFDDTGWSNQLPHTAHSTLISPPIDLSGATADPVLELEIRYYGTRQVSPYSLDGSSLVTSMQLSYNDGPWEETGSRTQELGIHLGPWLCSDFVASQTRCTERWVHAVLPLARRTPSDTVRISLSTRQTFDGNGPVEPQNGVVFAVRRARIDINPRRFYASVAGHGLFSGIVPPAEIPPEGVAKNARSAVTFPVPAGATIKRFSVSLTARLDSQNHWFSAAQTRVRFPNGHESGVPFWFDNEDGRVTRYHLEFSDAPPAGTSAVGEFSLESQGVFHVPLDSLGIYPWFAELVIE
jgi:hypothetical protein